MALKLNQQIDNTGLSAEYWVAESHNNKKLNKENIIMLLFKDLQSRQDGKDFIRRESFEWVMEGCFHTGAEIYSFVKESRIVNEVETNKFASAEDV